MEAKHTPGPWFNNPDWQEDDGEAGAIIRQENPDEIICPEVWGQDMGQRDANARLIAAAPDLLAAMLKAQDFIIQIFDLFDVEEGEPLYEQYLELMEEIADAETKAGGA